MQYLQGKGLCLMPISLASAISSATCHPRPSVSHLAGGGGAAAAIAQHLIQSGPNPQAQPNNNNHVNPDGPSSPNLSVLTAQSAMANGNADSHKDSSSAWKRVSGFSDDKLSGRLLVDLVWNLMKQISNIIYIYTVLINILFTKLCNLHFFYGVVL